MKVYFVDIDGTICNNTDGSYDKAVPILCNINKINSLYDEGNEIVYWTARGTTTGLDWTGLTTQQLRKWGARYTELRMKKPYYDMFICDKAINSDSFFNGEKNVEM